MEAEPPFALVQLGPFSRGQVRLTLADAAWTPVPSTELAIAATWDEKAADAARQGRLLFPGGLVRIDAWRVDGEMLELDARPTDYGAFLGTNLSRPEWEDEFGPDALASPLGVMAVVRSVDGALILQRRSGRVMEYPGRLHCCAGSMHPDDGHPFRTMERECSEELGIEVAEIADIRCLGLARDNLTRKPELMLSVRTSLPAEGLLARAHEEFSELLAIPDDRMAIASFLAAAWNDCVPGCLATLTAYCAVGFMEDASRAWR